MYCQKCQTQNEESAQFCRNCGTNLRYTQQETQTENNVSSTLLVIFIIVAFVSTFAQILYYWLYLPWLIMVFKVIQSISFILPALAIKNKSLKIIGIIFAALVVICSLFFTFKYWY